MTDSDMAKQNNPAKDLRELEKQLAANQDLISEIQTENKKLIINAGLIGMTGAGLTLASYIAAMTADIVLTGGIVTTILIAAPTVSLGINAICLKRQKNQRTDLEQNIIQCIPAPSQEPLPPPPQIKALLKLAGPSIAFNSDQKTVALKNAPPLPAPEKLEP